MRGGDRDQCYYIMESEIRQVLTVLGLENWNLEGVLKFARLINQMIEIQRKIESCNLTTKVKSKHGVHYKECVWANDDVECGPDTCVCSYIGLNEYNIKTLLDDIAKNVKQNEKHRTDVTE